MNRWVVSSIWRLLGKAPRYSVSVGSKRIFSCVTVTTYTIYDCIEKRNVHSANILPDSTREFLVQREPLNPWLF